MVDVLWKTIKSLLTGDKSTKNIVIALSKPELNPKKCSKLFNRLFTIHPAKANKADRGVKRQLNNYASKKKIPLNTKYKEKYQIGVFFNTLEVMTAIKGTKTSKAFGPDEISPIMLKHLGPITIIYLTALIIFFSLATLIRTWGKPGVLSPSPNLVKIRNMWNPTGPSHCCPQLQSS